MFRSANTTGHVAGTSPLVGSLSTGVLETRTATGWRMQLILARFGLNHSVRKPTLFYHLKLNGTDKEVVTSGCRPRLKTSVLNLCVGSVEVACCGLRHRTGKNTEGAWELGYITL